MEEKPFWAQHSDEVRKQIIISGYSTRSGQSLLFDLLIEDAFRPRAPAQKMLPPTLLIWFAFLFKYVSICFLVGFSCFLMTSSWFYMFFDDIFMLFEGAFDGWKAPLSCVCGLLAFVWMGLAFWLAFNEKKSAVTSRNEQNLRKKSTNP